MPLPTLFVPHGAPTFALKPGAAGATLVKLAQSIERPRAIVVISPHWETRAPCVGSGLKLETIHDFGGFPDELYKITYPAQGDASIAKTVADCLTSAGHPVHIDPHRGLDHGAWVPLRMMYPDASVPIIPLSIMMQAGAASHYALGQALAPLASEGILIMGTGSITHNLRDYMTCAHLNAPTPGYVADFSAWMKTQVEHAAISQLIDYRHLAPAATRAHPSEDHLMPFFVALGAAGANPRGECLYAGVDDYVIAMDAYRFTQAVQ